MASNTPNLNLLKKDPLTDGNETFNIQTMLNENWDRVDQFAGQTVPISRGGTGKTTAAAALAALGGIGAGAVGNLHVWKRTQVLSEAVPAVPAGYTLGTVEENVVVASSPSSYAGTSNEKILVSRASGISVDSETGEVTLVSPKTSTTDPLNLPSILSKNVLANCSYFTFEFGGAYGAGQSVTLPYDGVVYIPSDATVICSTGDVYVDTVSKLQRVTGYAATPEIPAGTHVDYLTSTDPEAYQESSNGAAAYYTLGEKQDLTFNSYNLNSYATFYGETITVSDDGTVSRPDTQFTYKTSSTTGGITVTPDLRGVFLKLGWLQTVYWIPDDTVCTGVRGSSFVDITYTNAQPVTGHAAVPANTTIEYLGQLGGGAKIEVGIYVGTGTYGQSNPNTLTFGFKPQAVCLLYSANSNAYNVYTMLMLNGFGFASTKSGDGNGYGCYVTWRDKSVSWYATKGSMYQLNMTNVKTYYIAIS